MSIKSGPLQDGSLIRDSFLQLKPSRQPLLDVRVVSFATQRSNEPASPHSTEEEKEEEGWHGLGHARR